MSLLNRQLASANNWRSQFNPLRGLTVQRAVSLLELGERGAYADLQWAYRFVEMSYGTLSALIARRTSAMKGLDFNVKTVEEKKLPKGYSQADADKQATVLRAVYDQIDNLREAVEFLSMAEFRGFAHLEKQVVVDGADPVSPQTPSQVNHLEPVDQWYWVRDGINGDWKYNGDAASGTVRGADIDYEDFLIREVARPINRIAILAFLRTNMSQKDWDAFVEIYGLAQPIIIGPPGVPTDKQNAYRDAAEEVANGQSGYLPNGSTVEYPTGMRGAQPFDAHKKDQNSEVVLVGTGGKLTMLTESGSGTLAGEAHKETFEEIAEAEAGMITELFNCELDGPILDEKFPGQPHLAYFELAATDEVDVTLVFDHAVKAEAAGFTMDAAQLSEKTGYTLVKAAAPAPGQFGVRSSLSSDLELANRGFFRRVYDAMFNRAATPTAEETRASLIKNAMAELGKAKARNYLAIRHRLELIEAMEDPKAQQAAAQKLHDDLPSMLPDNDAQVKVWSDTISAALIDGMAESAAQRKGTK